MTTLEIILIITNVLTLVLYLSSKFNELGILLEVIKEIKEDIKKSSTVVADLFTKKNDIVFD